MAFFAGVRHVAKCLLAHFEDATFVALNAYASKLRRKRYIYPNPVFHARKIYRGTPMKNSILFRGNFGKMNFNMAETFSHIVIQGLTASGRPFRPSDWAERLSGVFSVLGVDHRLNYSPYVTPTAIDGVRCVVVDKQLEALDPRAYRFLLGFARDNELHVIESSCV